MRKFDRYQELNEALNAEGQTPPAALQVLADLDAILKLANFRRELREFLEEHGLDSSLTTDSEKWHTDRQGVDCFYAAPLRLAARCRISVGINNDSAVDCAK